MGLDEVDDGLWTLHFATTRLARFDERAWTLRALLPTSTEARLSDGSGGAAAPTAAAPPVSPTPV